MFNADFNGHQTCAYLFSFTLFLRIFADFYLFYVDIFFAGDLQLGVQHDFAINSNLIHPHFVLLVSIFN